VTLTTVDLIRLGNANDRPTAGTFRYHQVTPADPPRFRHVIDQQRRRRIG
jgi:hypothetical protein